MSTETKPDRPTRFDDDVVTEVAGKLADDLVREGMFEPRERDELVDDIAAAIEERHDLDGYAIASWLDQWFGWDVTAQHVEVLDGALTYALSAVENREKEWVTKNNVTPPFSIGTKVAYTENLKKKFGEITWIYADRGKYLVFCEADGHIRQSDRTGTMGTIIDYERVTHI